MNRRTLIKGIFGGIVALCVGLGASLGFSAEKLDAETLKKRLATRNREEEKFIEKVVRLMNEKKLSEKSVNAAYKFAMKRRTKRFAYFAASIKKLAKNEGVDL